MPHLRETCIALLSLWLTACASHRTPPPELPPATQAALGDPLYNWTLPPSVASDDMAFRQLDGLAKTAAGGGTTGAMKATVRFEDTDDIFHVKWKRMPRGLDGWNNAPRKEIAAYAIQSLFLDADDYVVPATVARCIAVERLDLIVPGVEPSLDDSACVFGAVALWLRNVTVPERLYDESRFLADATYAYRMADFNLLTYLTDHRDGRRGNFLVSTDEQDRRVFAIDNGIAFGSKIYNYFVTNWHRLRVPALRRDSIDRLRLLDREDLDQLGVLVEMHLDDDGVYRNVPPGKNLDPTKGARRQPDRIQLGLTRSEIDAIETRIAKLLKRIDRGKIGLF